MRHFAFLLLVTIFSVIFSSLSSATVSDRLLRDGFGARGAGMGGAYTALADDVSAIFYNPAGLAENGFCYNLGNMDSEEQNGPFSLTMIKLGYLGFVQGRAADNSGGIDFSYLGLSNRTGWLNWGANFKKLNWSISGLPGEGWSSDIGLLFRLTPELKLGLVAQDILTSKEPILPAAGRIGLAYRLLGGRLTLSADGAISSGQTTGYLGLETDLANGLTLRTGLNQATPTLGASLNFSFLSFDYAAAFLANGQNLQRFEVGIKLLPDRPRPFSLVKPKEFVLIDVSGALKGGESEVSLFSGSRLGVDPLLRLIDEAAKDSSVDGIVFRLGGFSGGLGGAASVQELREALRRFQAKGKKVVAYIEGTAVEDEYYLASAADWIVAAPGSSIGGLGKSVALYRWGGFFEKIGVSWEVSYRGRYKNIFDWLNPGMSAEQKKLTENLLGDIYRQMINDIATNRRLELDNLKELGNGLVYSAKEAKDFRLIDQIGYLRESAKAAGELCGVTEEAKLIEPRLVRQEEALFGQVFGVAVIEIDGEIVSGSGGDNFLFGGRQTGSDQVAAEVRRAADDVLVRAILLRINSGGGSAVAAGEIYRSLDYAREKKKIIIASLGNVAASGGYYIACAADKIVANPSTITGSIGIIGYYPRFSGLLKEWGIKVDVIKEGEHADMFSGLRSFNTRESAAISKIIDEGYEEFLEVVARGRNLTTAEVLERAQGKIYSGSRALELKLIDQLGGFHQALELLKSEAQIKGDPRLIYYRRQFNPFWQVGSGVSSWLGLNSGNWLPFSGLDPFR